MSKTHFYPPIGIAGAALVGKDKLCSALIYSFLENYNLKAKRFSIAGDTIKKDLKSLIFSKTGIDSYTTSHEEKTVIRPLLLEYGRLMRNKTKGRYFIEILEKTKGFATKSIPIIPDIRYTEYEKDEFYWLKTEKKGLLVFLERNSIKAANKFEETNNKILKKHADFVFKIPTFKTEDDYFKYINKITNKIITTYLQDIFQP
jgi:uncharacterized protein Smg (DUF494 family)